MATLSNASHETGQRGRGCGSLRFLQAEIADFQTSVAVWRERSARRRAALHIDDRTLSDIGLIRAQVEHEAGKPFWKP